MSNRAQLFSGVYEHKWQVSYSQIYAVIRTCRSADVGGGLPSGGSRGEGMWGGGSGGLQNRKEGLARHWLTHTLIFVAWRAKVEESIGLEED